MATQDPIKTIQVRFNKTYAKFFDEFFNCELSNRIADSGFIEVDRPQLGPRRGTTRVGNALISTWSSSTAYVVGDVVISDGVLYRCSTNNTNSLPPSANWTIFTGGTSKQFWYTDRQSIRRAFKVFNNILYYLNGTTWTSLGDIGTTNVEFSTQKVPMLNILPWSSTKTYVAGERVIISGVIYNCILGHTNQSPPNGTYWAVSSANPTEYTVSGATTTAETVKYDSSDIPNANGNVGKILMVTSGVYKGCYASIIARGSSDYTLGGSGILVGLAAGTKYKLFDFVGDALAICRGEANLQELFYDGIIPLTHVTGYVTDSLRQVAALTSTETVKKIVGFNSQVWTYKGGTLYYTGGFPGNPFFFNFTTSLTLGGNGSVIDIFQYKTRLITIGTNFIFSVPTTLIIDRHITSFGGLANGYVNTGDDVYISTNQGDIISLKETINGVVGVDTVVGQEVKNYTKDFRYNLCFGFDGRRLYMYGEASAGTAGNMCVLDTVYQFWSVYTGLRPSSIQMEQGVLYMTDNYGDIMRSFSDTVTTDVAIGTNATSVFSQSFSLKEVDLNDIFTGKTLRDLYMLFENYTQSVMVDLFVAINFSNARKISKVIDMVSTPIEGGTFSESNIGSSGFGFAGAISEISLPIMKHIQYAADAVNIFKIRISGYNGSVFYMSQLDFSLDQMPSKDYFDPSNTY